MEDHDQVPSLNPTDFFKSLKIIYNPETDTLTRLFTVPCTNPTNTDDDDHSPAVSSQPVLTRDLPLNSSHKTWLRLFLPTSPPPSKKLPLIIYFHGGGFVLMSAADTMFHDFCSRVAVELQAVVISVDYRLGPESRLPAAYDDAIDAIYWVREQALVVGNDKAHDLKNVWLREYVDFSTCCLMGSSAGGNIAFHASLRCLPLDLEPVKIVGMVLIQPFFGGRQRSGSEMRLGNDGMFTLDMSDAMWELALPKGADRDHEYCNPMAGDYGEKIGGLGRILVCVRGGDLLRDKEMEFVKMIEEKGGKVKCWFEEEGYHGVELFDHEKASELLVKIRHFIYEE